MHCIVVEVELPESIVSLSPFHFSAPPSDAATSADASITATAGPHLFVASTSNTTLVKDSPHAIGDRLQLSKSVSDKLKLFALEKVSEAFPLAASHIIHVAVTDAYIGGFQVSSTTAKYTTKLGAHTDISGLFLGGKDISSTGLMGEIQAGLITANAMLGYTANEILLGSGLYHDLELLRKG